MSSHFLNLSFCTTLELQAFVNEILNLLKIPCTPIDISGTAKYSEVSVDGPATILLTIISESQEFKGMLVTVSLNNILEWNPVTHLAGLTSDI